MTLLDRANIDGREAGIAVLRTTRLALRAPRIEDAKRVAALANKRRIAENTAHIPHPYGIGDATDWITAATSQPGTFVITTSGELIGACSLEDSSPCSGLRPQASERLSKSRPPADRGTRDPHAVINDAVTGNAGALAGNGGDAAELGYWIGVPFWGCGYATEAARGLIDYAFGDLGYKVLTASARVSNPASRRVLEKCGFRWTGVGLRRIRAIGSSAPVDRFRLERP